MGNHYLCISNVKLIVFITISHEPTELRCHLNLTCTGICMYLPIAATKKKGWVFGCRHLGWYLETDYCFLIDCKIIAKIIKLQFIWSLLLFLLLFARIHHTQSELTECLRECQSLPVSEQRHASLPPNCQQWHQVFVDAVAKTRAPAKRKIHKTPAS